MREYFLKLLRLSWRTSPIRLLVCAISRVEYGSAIRDARYSVYRDDAATQIYGQNLQGTWRWIPNIFPGSAIKPSLRWRMSPKSFAERSVNDEGFPPSSTFPPSLSRHHFPFIDIPNCFKLNLASSLPALPAPRLFFRYRGCNGINFTLHYIARCFVRINGKNTKLSYGLLSERLASDKVNPNNYSCNPVNESLWTSLRVFRSGRDASGAAVVSVITQ